MKFFYFFLAVVSAFYVFVVVVAYFFQRKLQYFPSHREPTPSEAQHFQSWEVNGKFLGHVHRPSSSVGEILFFHGNGGQAIDRAWLWELIPNFTIYLAEYPGYGTAAGEPSEVAILKQALNQFDAIKSTRPVVVMGESLGSGVASYVAAERHCRKLLLISPFSSAIDVGRGAYPFLPISLLMKDRFESTKFLANAKQTSLLIFHGTVDSIIPIQLAQKLYASFHGEKQFIEIPGADHNDMVNFLFQDPYRSNLYKFIQ